MTTATSVTDKQIKALEQVIKDCDAHIAQHTENKRSVGKSMCNPAMVELYFPRWLHEAHMIVYYKEAKECAQEARLDLIRSEIYRLGAS